MGEFSGKKFYGYSVEADPDLMTPTWNTKNFEFSCIRPEAIERAIEKVQSEVGASIKQKKSHLLSKLRERGGEDFGNAFQIRDVDVETCISKSQSNCMNGLEQIQVSIRKMSDGEKGGSTTEHSSHSSNGGDEIPQKKSNQHFFDLVNQKDEREFAKVVVEEYNRPQPRWVEIIEPQMAAMQMFDLRQAHYQFHPNMYQGQMTYNPYMPPPQHMMAGYAYNPQQMMENYEYQNIYTDYDPRAYQVEDSDLEDEMIRRKHYTKFCTQRPNVDETRISDENDGCAEFVNIAPQEPFTDMSFLKSTAPMRYSELSDDEGQEAELADQNPKVIIKKRNQETNKDKAKSEKQTQHGKEAKQRKERSMKVKQSTLAQIIAEEKILANPPRPTIPKTIAKRLRKQTMSPSSPSINRKQSVQSRNVPVEPMPKPILITPSGKSIEQLKAEKIAIFNKMSRTHERLIDALEQLRSKVMEVHIPESTSDRNRRNRNGFEFSVRFLRNFLYPLKGMIDTMRNTSKEQFNSAASNDACNRVAHIYSLFLQAVLTYGKQLRHFMIDQVPQKLTTLLEMLFSTTNLCLDKRLFDRNDAIVECLISRCSNFLNFLEDLHAKRFVAARETYRKVSDEHPESKYNLKMFMNDLNMYEPKLVPKKTTSSRQQPRINRKGVPNSTASTTAGAANIAPFGAPLPQPARRMRKRMKNVKTASKQRIDGDNCVSDTSDVIVPKRAEEDVPTQIQNWEQIQSSDPEQHETNDIIEGLQNALINTPDLDKYKKVKVINRAILGALKRATNDEARDVLKPLLKTINAVMDIPENSDDIENILKAFQTKISIALKERKFIHETGKGHRISCEANTSSSHQKLCHTFINHENDLKEPDCIEEPSDDDSQQYEDCQNIIYDEDDDDGRFYISGEDCSSRRTTRSSKNTLEPLVEMVDENEFAELLFSDNDLESDYSSQQAKILDSMMNPVKQSPYDTPCCPRKNKGQKKVKSGSSSTSLSKNKKPATASTTKCARQIPQSTPTMTARPSCSKIKQTTVPPSPAMMRLKQRGQPISTSRSKHHNLPKKHNRRDPMGSPPPAPTVSPSTSVARTLSTHVSDFHLSLATTAASHKGGRAAISSTSAENCSKKSSRHTVTTQSSSGDNIESHTNALTETSTQKSSYRQSPINTEESNKFNEAVQARTCESIQEENDSGEETTRPPTTQIKHRRKHQLEQYNGGTESCRSCGDGPVVVNNESLKCKEISSKSSGLGKKTYTLYPGNNPYMVDKSSETLPMLTKTTDEKNSLSSLLKRRLRSKIGFDETSILKDRDHYLSLCIRNRLYTNPKYASPWKIISRLSEQLTEEIVQAVESDFSSGVLTFVDDFLEQETKTCYY